MTPTKPHAAKPKPRRRWLQYSLRTLLVLVMLASIGASWLGVKIRRAKRQEDAVQTIARAGGVAHRDRYEPGCFQPQWLRQLLGEGFFCDVVGVEFDWSPVTSREMACLQAMPNLRFLYLQRTELTDGALEHLRGMSHLERLVLDLNPITGVGLAPIQGMPRLWHLSLDQTEMTDAGLAYLRGMTRLRILKLGLTNVTDGGLVHLKGMTQLRELDLNLTLVSDTGLKHLRGMTKLEELRLDHTCVTDGGLEHLAGMAQLRVLMLDGTEVTARGVTDLQRVLPKCRIVWSPPTTDERQGRAAPDQPSG